MTRPWLPNPARDGTWTSSPVPRDVLDFHRGLAGYAPTRLVDLPALAAELRVGRVLVKDESQRLGLPAFKSLGASWAIHRALRARLRGDPEGSSPVTLVAATDGNHGRAVARFARLLGHRARIFVPDGVHPAAVQAIRDEGADVTAVPADYDEAVRTAARYAADTGGILIQDTAWAGYEEVPRWIVAGYSTLFRELDDQFAELGIAQPDLVLVPTGVGSLLHAALTHYREHPTGPETAVVVSVEPVAAACVQASIAAGHPVSVATGHTIMAGLNCGTVSSLAWPSIHRGLDAAATVTDDQVTSACRDLAENGVPVGPCGAAPLAAARTLAATHQVSAGTTVVLIATEGESANPVSGAASQSRRRTPG